MKKAILAGAMALTSALALAQTPPEYQVAPWHGFSSCAVTYSFDDLCPNQLPVAIPILEKYGIRASLNIVTDWVKPELWAQVREAGLRGHEIASHTISHPNLAEKTAEQFEAEQRDSKKILEERTGLKVSTMVYPFCVSTHEEITGKYYIGARICDGRIEPHTPAQMLRISSRGVGPMYGFNSAAEFNAWADQGAKDNGWCTFLIHGIDGDGGYSAIKSQDLEEHVSYVAANPGKFWPATFAQVCKYILERNSLEISEQPCRRGFRIAVKCGAESNVADLDQPITISRSLPARWKQASVLEDGKPVECSAADGRVAFDVLPGRSYEIRKK